VLIQEDTEKEKQMSFRAYMPIQSVSEESHTDCARLLKNCVILEQSEESYKIRARPYGNTQCTRKNH